MILFEYKAIFRGPYFSKSPRPHATTQAKRHTSTQKDKKAILKALIIPFKIELASFTYEFSCIVAVASIRSCAV